MTINNETDLKQQKKSMVFDLIYKKYLNFDERQLDSYTIQVLEEDIKNISEAIFPKQFDDNDRYEISKSFREKIGVIALAARVLTDPKKKYDDWYTDDLIKNQDNFYWNRFKTFLEQQATISKPVITRLDSDSKRIVKKLGNPGGGHFLIKGMVIGNVQAGKTLSYSAVINKAIDAGYILIIVLAGSTEYLRSQTQSRLNRDVIGKTFKKETSTALETPIGVGLISLDKGFHTIETSEEDDFNLTRKRSVDLDQQTAPSAIVAKKNVNVLKDLNKWLRSTGKQAEIPVLLIDDEADNASVNTGKEDEDPKAINREIRNILKNCNRITYLAYTATPMANIFIKPDEYNDEDYEDLFPSDFLVSLQAPTNYCGGDFFFINEETSNLAVEEIEDNENSLPVKHKKIDPIISLPNSLIEALEYFYIICAVKDIRRQKGIIDKKNNDNLFDSFLINVSIFQRRQNDLKPMIENEVDKIYDAIHAYGAIPNNNSTLIRLKKVFDEKVSKNEDLNWSQILEILQASPKPEVISINRESPDKLNWDIEGNKRKIVIGGYILSRGLTLLGLTVSYILRNSQAYDTLMQMGRWFGYRNGYTDLVKLWCTKTTRRNYSHISLALEEFNDMITTMERENLAPRDFGMRIKSHPEISVTAKNKMRSAIEWQETVSFSDTHYQTYVFDKNQEIQDNNEEAVFTLLDEIKHKIVEKNTQNSPHILFNDVPFNHVYRFLEKFKIHTYNSVFGDHDLLMRYLAKHQSGFLSNWDVAIFAKKSGSNTVESIKNKFNKEIMYEDRTIYFSKDFPNDRDALYLSGNRGIGASGTRLIGLEEGQERADRIKPILIIHFLNAKTKNDTPENLKEYKNHKFMGITQIIPSYKGEDDSVAYMLNKKYYDDHFITANIGWGEEEEE